MDVSLPRLSSRVLLITGAVVCAGVIGLTSIRIAVAAHWAGSQDAVQWQRAAQLEPGNADLWGQLGLFEEWDFERGDLRQSIVDFRRATRLNPHSDRLWMDLAGAYEVSGQPDRARQAYQAALEAHPDSADVAWRYGSFLLRQGDTAAAAGQIRRALIDEPELVPSAVSQFVKAGAGLDVIFGQVVPARPAGYLELIRYFVSRQDLDAALATWARLDSLHAEIPLTRALDLIDRLIDGYRIDDAARIWRQALVAAGISSPPDTHGSLVFNGDFETNFLGGGFDWRQSPADGAAFDLVADVAHSGQRSARVSFDGTRNVDFQNLEQFVPVQPGGNYEFSAYMRTDGISTDSGLEFWIADSADPGKPIAQTPVMTGTHDWTRLQRHFTASRTMRCALIVLRRLPSSMMFDNKIRGTVWVDDVRLVEEPGAPASSQ
ncbi:MAG TPA: tetratricopeptide repeat protein [Candidatus Acidoferrales bacterium]|nr:tetratricopeptide repeat protein [Candidatus Acidoferrales bacterium]